MADLENLVHGVDPDLESPSVHGYVVVNCHNCLSKLASNLKEVATQSKRRNKRGDDD